MVINVQTILNKYDVRVEKNRVDERSTIMVVHDEKKSLPNIEVHFVDSRVYQIIFANNQFFEIPMDDLEVVLQGLLEGAYDVKKSLFRDYYIKVKKEQKYILPERVSKMDKTQQRKIYALLPLAFSLRK